MSSNLNHLELDCSQNFIFKDLHIRGSIVKLDKVYSEINGLQQADENSADLLGQVLVAAVMMIQNIKIESELTVQFQTESGDIKLLAAKINSKGEVRATLNCRKEPHKPLLGEGFLVVTISQLNQNKAYQRPYQSVIAVAKGQTISEALSDYFEQSEQLPSLFKFVVSQNKAVGIMIQQTQELVKEDDWETVSCLYKSLTDQELLELDNKTILHRLFNQYDLNLFDAKRLVFKCSCSLEKMQNAVMSLGKVEALDIMQAKKLLEVKCEYCKKTYSFDKNDIERLFNQH